jgi:hypothetical protein
VLARRIRAQKIEMIAKMPNQMSSISAAPHFLDEDEHVHVEGIAALLRK